MGGQRPRSSRLWPLTSRKGTQHNHRHMWTPREYPNDSFNVLVSHHVMSDRLLLRVCALLRVHLSRRVCSDAIPGLYRSRCVGDRFLPSVHITCTAVVVCNSLIIFFGVALVSLVLSSSTSTFFVFWCCCHVEQ